MILACRDAKRGEALKQTLLEQAEKLGLPTSEPEVSTELMKCDSPFGSFTLVLVSVVAEAEEQA